MTLRDAIHAYDEATRLFLHEAGKVPAERLDRRVDGGWSARQIIHHVADSETHSYLRLRRLLCEPAGSLVQGYDEAAWAASDVLGYRELAVEGPLRLFGAVRAASSAVLHRIGEADLERYGEHSESGRYTLERWLELYSSHPREHAQQMREAVNS